MKRMELGKILFLLLCTSLTVAGVVNQSSLFFFRSLVSFFGFFKFDLFETEVMSDHIFAIWAGYANRWALRRRALPLMLVVIVVTRMTGKENFSRAFLTLSMR